jgi:hypothetical protein
MLALDYSILEKEVNILVSVFELVTIQACVQLSLKTEPKFDDF